MSEETVKVGLGDDYYHGAYFRTVDTDLDYEVPKSQLERWEAAEAAYDAMQDEINQVMREQRQTALALMHERHKGRNPNHMSSLLQDIYGPAILAQLAQPITVRIPKEPE